MKNKEIKELKNKPVDELEKLLKDDRQKLNGLKFNLAAGKVKDVTELRVIKKNIARILTFLKINEIEKKHGK